MTQYNGLYPDVKAEVLESLNEYLRINSPMNISSFRALKVCQYIRFGTKLALKNFSNRVCNRCPSHDMWVVAGVFAGHVTSIAKRYTDVDIFVQCSCDLEQGTFNLGYTSVHVTRNVVSLTINNVAYQLIQVPFSVGQNRLNVLDMFAAHVVCNFDISACRVAIKFAFKNKPICYVLDFSAIDYIKSNTKSHRIEKYRTRITKKPKQPPSLRALCMFNLLKLSSV